MVRNALTHIVLALLFLGIFCAASSAAPWTTTVRVVGQSSTSCPNPQYATITEAVNAASPGDEIDICPALYAEQLIITKPLTLRGLEVDGVKRVLIQPSSLVVVDGLGFVAVITVMNTWGVTIENLAVDAGKNGVSSCAPGLAAIHFHNASGTVRDNAIFGAQLTNPLGCTTNKPYGNGFGVQVDATASGPFQVDIKNNSIHDFTSDGVLVQDNGVKANVCENMITGVGPSGGIFQFGVFIAIGAVGLVQDNVITEGNCGTLSISDCINVRSEGVTLRAVGDGTVVNHNIITKAQSGIFANGANGVSITNNIISNIDALSGMDIQGTASGFFTNSVIEGNTVFNVGPINVNASNNEEGCGINEYSGTGVSGNTISHNTVNDAYCGVAYVTADHAESNVFLNTLYTELNSDSYPSAFPPALEP